jgi:membrane-associated phospholipid phosphatase
MRFLTDFADQAVVLPLIPVVALALAGLSWRRGAVAWVLAVGGCFAVVLVLKLVSLSCGVALGVPELRSPSGHTAAVGVIAGALAVLLGGRPRTALVAAIAGALLIGVTRVVLGLHSPIEVVLGGVLGVAGALGFAWLAGRPPPLRLRWLFAALAATALLLHGRHLDAETSIRAVATSLPVCGPLVEASGQPRP